MSFRQLYLSLCLFVIALPSLTFAQVSKQEWERCTQELYQAFPNFPEPLCSWIPSNVLDKVIQSKIYRCDPKQLDCMNLLSPTKLADPAVRSLMKRQFEILAWQTLIGVSWPVAGTARSQCRSEAAPYPRPSWRDWYSFEDVFGPPKSEAEAPRDGSPMRAQSTNMIEFGPSDKEQVSNSGVLWDQNGNPVYYETLINQSLATYIRGNALNTLDGQIRYMRNNQAIAAPWGNSGQYNEPGAMTMKLSWKILTGADDPNRYYTERANVEGREETIGLVGVHIAHRIQVSTQWIWMTFEHVDNLRTNGLERVDGNRPLRPSFYNSDCAHCVVNVVPAEPDADNKRRTQVMRTIPIDIDTESLNQQVRGILRRNESFWQYFELIGVQWPTRPSEKPSAPTKLPDAIVNQSGGWPTPAFLVNSTIETYLQKGNQPVSELTYVQAKNDSSSLFVTSSCMGCHADATIATGCEKGEVVGGGLLSGDFLWLFSKAPWSSQAAKEEACRSK